MTKSKRTTILILAIIAAIYFAIFIFPNLSGAQDANMLSAFEHDEFAQYPHVIRMLTPCDTLYQSLRNFVVYLHYFYGYPFYFFSALAILPVKLILGSTWTDNTSVIVMVLRQLINVLPIIVSVILLVWIQTRFKSIFKSILLGVLLLTIPAVVSNNMWWHPDSLLTLFAVLTIFFLVQDDFRYGKNFYFSGIACGLAVGAKTLGVLFVFTYLVYILYGMITRRISFPKLVLHSILFLLVMLGTVVVTNPLLLLPIERSEIIAAFKQLLNENTVGFWVVGNPRSSMFAQVFSTFNENYGSWVILLVSVAALLYGLVRKESSTTSIVISTWLIGYVGYFLLFASTMRSHYLIPVALPLLSSLVVFIPSFSKSEIAGAPSVRRLARLSIIASPILALGILIQVGANMYRDADNITKNVNREQTSPSIQLFQQAETQVLSRIPLDRKVRIYRDWRAYVAPRASYNITYDWSLANYPYIQEIDPDVLFIEYDNMLYFSDASKIVSAIDPASMKGMVTFYTDAINGRVNGYTLALKTDYGSVFVRDDLHQKYW